MSVSENFSRERSCSIKNGLIEKKHSKRMRAKWIRKGGTETLKKKKRWLAALVQMDTGANLETNLQHATKAIEIAVAKGVDLVCFPERMNMQSVGNVAEHMAETAGKRTMEVFQKKAKEYGIFLHCGSLYEKIQGEERCSNTSVLLGPDGAVLAKYSKLHMFDVDLEDGTACKESQKVKAGDDIVVVDTALGKLGFAICYDIRFPEMFRKMMEKGVQVIIVPASFTSTTGKNHWEPLLRARAIENQVYLLAPNQTGKKPEFEAYGHSMAIDPWGTVLTEAGVGETILYAEINLDKEDDIRKQIPCIMNRRRDIY